MAQIFVSHSGKDLELVSFLSKAFSSTNVKAIFEEFDAIFTGPANAARLGFLRTATSMLSCGTEVGVLVDKSSERFRSVIGSMAHTGVAAKPQPQTGPRPGLAVRCRELLPLFGEIN
jgi:hypothetical protein